MNISFYILHYMNNLLQYQLRKCNSIASFIIHNYANRTVTKLSIIKSPSSSYISTKFTCKLLPLTYHYIHHLRFQPNILHSLHSHILQLGCLYSEANCSQQTSTSLQCANYIFKFNRTHYQDNAEIEWTSKNMSGQFLSCRQSFLHFPLCGRSISAIHQKLSVAQLLFCTLSLL